MAFRSTILRLFWKIVKSLPLFYGAFFNNRRFEQIVNYFLVHLDHDKGGGLRRRGRFSPRNAPPGGCHVPRGRSHALRQRSEGGAEDVGGNRTKTPSEDEVFGFVFGRFTSQAQRQDLQKSLRRLPRSHRRGFQRHPSSHRPRGG